MFDKFIAKYPPDDLEIFEIQLNKAYKTFPYCIASILRDYQINIVQEEYSKAFKRYIDFYEISAQYCSSLIFSLIKYRKVPFTEKLQQVATSIVEKPLSTGGWINGVFIVLIKEAQTLIPEEPLIASLFAMVTEPKGNILQGWSSKQAEEYKGIAYFRNTYLGHDTSLDEQIYADGLKLIEPRMFRMLEAMAPLAKLTTFSVDKIINDEKTPGKYAIIPLKSARLSEIGVIIFSDQKLEREKYYLVHREIDDFDHFKEDEIVGITPFVIYLPIIDGSDKERAIYLFQSIHEKNLKKMVYISPDLKAKKKTTELFKDYFVSFLRDVLDKINIGQNYKIEIASGKSWDEYKERLAQQTNKFLGQMKIEKYDSNIYVGRKEISKAWDYFFTLENKRAFVLLGNAGSGKTNLICNFAEKFIEEGAPVITFNCKIFSQISINDSITQLIGDSKTPLTETLKDLNKLAKKENTKVVFFFDAINECLSYNGDTQRNGAVALLHAVDNLLMLNEYNSFKVLITCRTYTWEEAIRSEEDTLNLPVYFTSDDIPDEVQRESISLKGFSNDEFDEAYPKYCAKFGIRTTIEALHEPQYAYALSRLHDPMVLKMACQIYANNNLPENIQQFDSVKLFEARIQKLSDSKSGNLQIMILEDFTRVMRNRKTDSLMMQQLYAATDDDSNELKSLSNQLFKGATMEWRDSALTLLDEGFLRVEKTTPREEFRFTYERFHEYMYARIFVQDETEQLRKGLSIPVEAYEKELNEMKGYAVINDALRHALVLDYYRTGGDPYTLIDLANSTVYGASQLVMNTLSSLISDNYEDVCSIVEQLLAYEKEESEPLGEEITQKEALVEKGNKGKNKLSIEDIQSLNQEIETLQEQLKPVIQVRKIAVQVIYEIFKSPVYEKNLFEGYNSPFELLWKAMSDPLAKVRDNVSLYIYYISKYNVEIGKQILNHLSKNILDTSLLSLAKGSKRKEFQQSFLEPAGRFSLLMVIDALIERNDYQLSNEIKETWTNILKKLTLNFTLIKVVMPFLKFFMSRQATVQVAYVNNGIEYQNFWENIPDDGADDDWHRRNFTNITPFLDPQIKGIEQFNDVLQKGIDTGDAFSYFLIERVMVVQGWADWKRIKPLIMEVVNKPADQPFLDYMQMSMLYVLFHSIEKSDEPNLEAFDVFANLTEEWSKRCKGLFYAHKNEQANKGLPYKQYPLNWYGAAYCKHYGDGGIRPGDPYPLPVFRNLIDTAFKRKDKELLYYCIENIATLVTDFGKPKSAIQLFDYVIGLFRHEREIINFDRKKCEREEYQMELRPYLCSMIGTIKSYYPREVAYFIHHKLAHSEFPEMDSFREDLMSYNQSHESIGDLLTHKFGNFIIWGLLHDKAVGKFFIDSFKAGGEVKDYFSWFDNVIRIAFNRLFGIKT
jgi:hypothetical protein